MYCLLNTVSACFQDSFRIEHHVFVILYQILSKMEEACPPVGPVVQHMSMKLVTTWLVLTSYNLAVRRFIFSKSVSFDPSVDNEYTSAIMDSSVGRLDSFNVQVVSIRTFCRPATLLKKRLWHRCSPVNFVKFLTTPFLQSTSESLLLSKYFHRLELNFF